MEPLSFEKFRDILADALNVSREKITPNASFINDLAVDSIRMVEMLLRMEELGVSVPPEAAWDIRTVGDAYDFYVKSVGSAA